MSGRGCRRRRIARRRRGGGGQRRRRATTGGAGRRGQMRGHRRQGIGYEGPECMEGVEGDDQLGKWPSVARRVPAMQDQ